MKRIKNIISFALASAMILSLAACGGGGESYIGQSSDGLKHNPLAGLNRDDTVTGTVAGNVEGFAVDSSNSYMEPSYEMPQEEFNTERYDSQEENRFMAVSVSPLSTFGADVDTASYANVRRMIKDGYYEIPSGAVRLEEFINYFNYDYDYPTDNKPFNVQTEIIDTPWNEDTLLMRIGVQTPKIDMSDAPPCNLVFLIDTSGSMFGEQRLGLVQKALSMLTDELDAKDRISIVTYAGYTSTLLTGASGEDKEEIKHVLDSLEAGGSTNGEGGINAAYEVAEDNFIDGGINRVILCTDGDLNVGATSDSELVDLITEKKKSGVFLSTIGVGSGNYNDSGMEKLADKGDGNYNYLDSLLEAKKVLVEEMGGTLNTVAKDAKFQLEFNPAYIKAYRQIGYENRQMAAEDFADDTKDGGEIGAGQQVTVLYEIVPVDSEFEVPDVNLKYTEKQNTNSTDWLTISVRYKEPAGSKSSLLEYTVNENDYTTNASYNTRFAACVAQFGMLLKDSEYAGTSSYKTLESELKSLLKENTDDYKDELLYLVQQAKNM